MSERRLSVPVIEFVRPRELRRATRPIPDESPLVAVELAGICGTDRHIYQGRIPVAAPRILGHELIGRIARIGGTDVLGDDVNVGDRVLVAPGARCLTCAACRSGARYCRRRRVYGFDAPAHLLTGGFSPFLALLPGTQVFRVPDDLTAGRAMFAELMACVMSGFSNAFPAGSVEPGAAVAVLGFGPIGLCAATLALSQQADVTVTDPDAGRRARAAELGFSVVTDPRPGGFDAVVDCAGNPAAFAAGVDLLRRGGTLLELGSFADLGGVEINPASICLRDLRVVGSGETLDAAFPAAVRAVGATSVDLDAALTHIFPFADLHDPHRMFTTPGVFKSALAFEPEQI